MERGGPTSLHAQSLYLTPCDFFLLHYFKNHAFCELSQNNSYLKTKFCHAVAIITGKTH